MGDSHAGFNRIDTDFRLLTAANPSRISPRHDLDRENHHENHEAQAGFGRRARVVERSQLLNRSPA